MTDFTLHATVAAPYEATVTRVRELLTEAGFGVLTEIDMAETLRAKLGVEMAPQVILGACRPPLAHAALERDPRVATLLPCNVVVADLGGDKVKVEVLDPEVMTGFSVGLAEVARDAKERLQGMLAALSAEGTN